VVRARPRVVVTFGLLLALVAAAGNLAPAAPRTGRDAARCVAAAEHVPSAQQGADGGDLGRAAA
jgi:hypothetical protein